MVQAHSEDAWSFRLAVAVVVAHSVALLASEGSMRNRLHATTVREEFPRLIQDLVSDLLRLSKESLQTRMLSLSVEDLVTFLEEETLYNPELMRGISAREMNANLAQEGKKRKESSSEAKDRTVE